MTRNKSAPGQAGPRASQLHGIESGASNAAAILHVEDIMSLAIAASSTSSDSSFLRKIYPLPNPHDSHQQWLRFWHDDIADMDEPALRREMTMVDMRLAMEEQPCQWLFWRRDALEEAIARHQARCLFRKYATSKRNPQEPESLCFSRIRTGTELTKWTSSPPSRTLQSRGYGMRRKYGLRTISTHDVFRAVGAGEVKR